MALSSDVKLSKEVTPAWPDRCVECGSESPGQHARLTDRSTSIWTTLSMQSGKKVSVKAPACPPCAQRIHRRQWTDRIVMVLSLVAGALAGRWFVAPLLPNVSQTWVLGGAAMLGYVVVVAWKMFSPPAFSILAWADDITYEFGDETCAREFAALNEAEIE